MLPRMLFERNPRAILPYILWAACPLTPSLSTSELPGLLLVAARRWQG